MDPILIILDFVGVLFAVWLLRRIVSRSSSDPLPPGPKPLPFIGNLLDMPSEYPWETFCKWGQRWGGLISINMLGQRMMIVNSYKVAVDLLEKRSSIYSDRPPLTSAEMIGYNRTVPLIPYGDRFREQRRMLNQTLGTRAQVEKFGPMEEHEIHSFLLNILEDSDELLEHIKRFTGAVVLLVSYGYQVKRKDRDYLLDRAFESVEEFADAALPGAFLADTIPALRYVPSWFPGAGWKHKVAKFSKDMHEFMEEALAFTKEQMASGIATSNFVSRNLERNPSSPEMEDIIKWTAISLVGGGSDTTTSTLHAFFLAVTLYPEVQAKAQTEIDAVIGSDRLPTFRDKDQLPYVNAICLELLRWLPVGPLGIPHRLAEDDQYEGYFLPKGSVFIVNLWGMLHDPERYRNPEEFNPGRFLKGPDQVPEEDPHNIVFSFGRRVCPGIHVADATLYIAVANVLAVFSITKRIENGKPVTPVAAQSSSSISHPLPFKCTVKPRSANAEALIHATNEPDDILT